MLRGLSDDRVGIAQCPQHMHIRTIESRRVRSLRLSASGEHERIVGDPFAVIELDLRAMETREPDLEGCRELFTELEFTTLLKELAPAPESIKYELIEEPTAEQTATFYAAARQHGTELQLATLTTVLS